MPAGSLQWVPINGCQGMAGVITSVFMEPPISEDGTLPANILISKCLLPVEQGVVHVPVVNLGEKDQWLWPKTFLGQLYMVNLQSALESELGESVNSQDMVSCNQVMEAGSGLSLDFNEASWPSLSAAQSQQAKCLLTRFSSVFSKEGGDLGCTHLVQHEIPVLDNAPVWQRYCRLPPSQNEQFKTHISELLEQGVVRPSSSPYSSPIVMQKKMEVSVFVLITANSMQKHGRMLTHFQGLRNHLMR